MIAVPSEGSDVEVEQKIQWLLTKVQETSTHQKFEVLGLDKEAMMTCRIRRAVEARRQRKR